MIPKEVTDALEDVESCCYYADDHYPRDSSGVDSFNVIKNFLQTSDRYIKDLEQHVDDLVASGHDG